MNDACFIDNKLEQDLNKILSERESYKPFNILVYNMKSDKMFYACVENGMEKASGLEKGKPYTLCNSDLDTMWPKS